MRSRHVGLPVKKRERDLPCYKLDLKGGYIGDYIGDYYRGYLGGY